jgi:hypothetical protein
MVVLLTAFTLFHLFVGTASVGLGMRLIAPEERAHWQSKRALLVAEIMCWVYPVLAFGCASFAWRSFQNGQAHAFPLIFVPILWLIVMGLVFAIVDFTEDGILGNARSSRPE